MQFNNYIKTKLPFFVALSFTFVLASCGSYQYVGYESDGIYSDNEYTHEKARTAQPEVTVTSTDNNSYYKNYFNEKANQYSEIPEDESVIFTDIESYEGDYSEEAQEEGVQNGYAGWGQASNTITINYIDNGWGFYDPWLWNGRWGYNYYGWGNWRYNNWGWNTGFGWGWNNYWGYNNWGWGYNNYWCPPGFNGYYYNNRNLAYNSGRRGSNLAYANRSSISRRNSSTISRRNSSAVSRRGSAIRNNSSTRSSVRRNTSRTRSNSANVRSRSNNRVTRPSSSSTRSNNNSRMSTTRSSRSSSARSSRSSRSSGTSSSSRRSSTSRRR